MIRSLTITATLTGLLLVPLAAVAQQGEERDDFTGIVLTVDASREILTVEQASADAPEMQFTITDATDVTKDGNEISLSEIRVGDPVSVEYVTTSEGNEAQSVKVITEPAT